MALGEAWTETITGGTVSTTVIVLAQEAELPTESVTVAAKTLVPKANVVEKETTVAFEVLPAAKEFV